MYLIKIAVKKSDIEGRGVFALQNVKKGVITWKFDPRRDCAMSIKEFETLNDKDQEALLRVAYLSPTTKRWVYPSEEDPASFTNHNKQNNQSVVIDISISKEPFFVANRNIKIGEELTVDYGEFDARPKKLLEEWI